MGEFVSQHSAHLAPVQNVQQRRADCYHGSPLTRADCEGVGHLRPIRHEPWNLDLRPSRQLLGDSVQLRRLPAPDGAGPVDPQNQVPGPVDSGQIQQYGEPENESGADPAEESQVQKREQQRQAGQQGD